MGKCEDEDMLRTIEDRALERAREQTSTPSPTDNSLSVRQELTCTNASVMDVVPNSPPEVLPLTTVADLLEYSGPGAEMGFSPCRNPFCAPRFPPRQSRLLVCHDMAGGYGEDRRVQGGDYDRAYRLYNWGLIDIFVYFSHNLVTIPPLGWTDVAHRHGTRVLGTFITEWDEGYKKCQEFLCSKESIDIAADKLASIAVDYGFDGWLINIENPVEVGQELEGLVRFLKASFAGQRCCLQTLLLGFKSLFTKRSMPLEAPACPPPPRKPGGLVLWYDSVTKEGKLDWQDCLNSRNREFFDACDGIFCNYTWKERYPSMCALEAEGRRFDVYMGIDVFGRGTWGGGGMDSCKAREPLFPAGVSAALFAPAWTMEDQVKGGGRVEEGQPWACVETPFGEINARFWETLASAWHAGRAIPGDSGPGLPLMTNFSQGVGDGLWVEGVQVASFARGQVGVALCCATQECCTQQGLFRESKCLLLATLTDTTHNPSPGGTKSGAFYNLTSQCLAPLSCTTSTEKLLEVVPMSRRHAKHKVSRGRKNGTHFKASRVLFSDAFDGCSCLCFTGVLHPMAMASSTLYRCNIPLPKEALEVLVTLRTSHYSDLCLELFLDLPEVNEHRVVLLRNDRLSKDSKTKFSRRVISNADVSSFSPVEEICHSTNNPEKQDLVKTLTSRVRELRDLGLPYDEIRSQLMRSPHTKGELEGELAQTTGPSTTTTSTPIRPGDQGLGPWLTRRYIIRDLRMGGSTAIREVKVVGVLRRQGRGQTSESSPRRGGPQRLGQGGDGQGREEKAGADGLNRELAAFRANLGNIVIGPWFEDGRVLFEEVATIRAVNVSWTPDGKRSSHPSPGGKEGTINSKFSGAELSLILEWTTTAGRAAERGSNPRDCVQRASHWDIWARQDFGGDGMELKGEGGGEVWQWAGRAYGRKYFLGGLRVEGLALVLATQQTNGMGYRQVRGPFVPEFVSLFFLCRRPSSYERGIVLSCGWVLMQVFSRLSNGRCHPFPAPTHTSH
ncbi:unnamed protein product, partial [Discosporangium mesarthrocarpum]